VGCEHADAPERIVMELDLEQARRRAKERLRAARRGDLVLRDDREPRLADAQRSVANELGFASWPALVAHMEATGGDRAQRAARLVREALAGRAERAEALLAADPGLARGDLAVALVLGDADTVERALAADPTLVSRELPGAGRRPLSCACHSAFLAPDQPRAAGVRGVVELLLDAGADPNETFENEYGAMPVLYGAAGVAHDPKTTRLLLDRGANPDDGESVYHSVEAQSTECLEILLERGATVRHTNALGNAQRRPDMQRLLLERGDLRPSDPELRDALLWVRGEESARLLIAHGADLEARSCVARRWPARPPRRCAGPTPSCCRCSPAPAAMTSSSGCSRRASRCTRAASARAPRCTTRACGGARARSSCCSPAAPSRT